jgi:hypothetical protein
MSEDENFKYIFNKIIKPSLNEVKTKYMAQINPNFKDSQAIYNAIKEQYDKSVTVIKSIMKNAGKDGLDSHKESACLCGAIVKCRILLSWEKYSEVPGSVPLRRAYMYPNELFAITAAMRMIKANMLVEYENDSTMCDIIEKNVPQYPTNIHDEFGYISNTIAYIRHFATQGEKSTYLFDTGAYATIFFHLDKENRDYVKDLSLTLKTPAISISKSYLSKDRLL